MENALVTVIVPVYKVEKYLDRCVESIINQTYRNLEIILVDDSSPDRCPQMCDEWASRDCRIKVIHKENQGLGMARNTGMEHAAGQYICFVDSDDYIAVDMIEQTCGWMIKECADLVVYGMASVDVRGNVVAVHPPRVNRQVYAGAEVQERLLPDIIGPDRETGLSADIPLSACCALFSANLIKRANWRFVSEREIISEDIYSMIALYAHTRKVIVLQNALYFYCENELSLSHTYRPDRYKKNRIFYIKCVELCKECGYCEEVTYRCAEPFLRNTIAAMKQIAAHHGRKAAVLELRGIIDDDLLQQVLYEKRGEKINLKKRILFWAIRHRSYSLCYALLTARNAAKK